MKETPTLLLTRAQVETLLTPERAIEAVEAAFRLHAEGKAETPGVLGVHAMNGGFHIKAGILNLNRPYFAAKINANFPGNPKRNGLPTIQGILFLADAENGTPLALMDSAAITTIRTGAATAVAIRYLANKDAKTATICGCGNQGRISLEMLLKVRHPESVFLYDTDPGKAADLAAEFQNLADVRVSATEDPETSVRSSDIVITCTPSERAFLKSAWISPGTFVAAIGADNEKKQELEPSLLAAGKLVTDLTGQCAAIGELHHALEVGILTRENVHAELGEVIAGKKTGRTSADEVTVFDSTGMALQDVAAAAVVYEAFRR